MSTAAATVENCRIFPREAPVAAKAAFYKDYGFLAVEDALSQDEVAALNRDAAKICRGDYGMFTGLKPAAPGETDDDVLQRHLCIHFPHKMSPVMRSVMGHPSVVEVLTASIGPNI